MRKLILLLGLFLVITSCSKEDECECYYSSYYGQFIPNKYLEEDAKNGGQELSEGQLKAIVDQCRFKGCPSY